MIPEIRGEGGKRHQQKERGFFSALRVSKIVIFYAYKLLMAPHICLASVSAGASLGEKIARQHSMEKGSAPRLTSSPRLKPGDSQRRTPVYKKIGSNVTVLLRRHATPILEGHAKSPLDSCSKSNFCLLFLRMFAAPLRSAFALRPSPKR